MDYIEACKESCAHEKFEVGRTRDEASYFSELEEGEFRKDDPFGSESLVHKDMDVRAIKLTSSAQVAIKRSQVNTGQSTSPERGTHRGGTANATDEQSNCSPLEGQPVNVRQPTFHRKCSENYHRSYSPSFHISSKESRKQRKHNCFRHYEYHHAREKIEKVCSERLSKLLLQQNGARKEFNILRKNQELEFFQEHVRSYKVHYERVIPTVRYDRMKLPKLLFHALREKFHKHIQPQLIKFVKQQINDRNKEKRMKERWIFEAKAGYIKKYFDETSLTYSEFEMEKSKWHVHDFSEGEQQLKYLDMQPLTSELVAIAYSSELADSNRSRNIDVSEPILENLQSPLEKNGGTEHELSVDAVDETTTMDSMPSQSNYEPSVEFSGKVVTQVNFSPPQNNGVNMGRSCSSEEVIDEALGLAKAVAADSENTLPVSRVKRRRTSSGDGASEGYCSRSQRELPHEFEEPRAARLSSVNVNQREQPDDAGMKGISTDQTSSVAQVTEQPNINSNSLTSTQSLTQLQHGDVRSQDATHPYQPADGNTCSGRIGLDNPGSSNVQQQPTNQMMTRFMVDQRTPEIRPQSDPIAIDLSEVLMSCSDHTSSLDPATEQRNIDACSSSSTLHEAQHQYCDQTVAHQHQPSGRNASSMRTWLDSPGEPNAQRQSSNQTTTGSTSERYMLERGPQSGPFTIELSRLLMLRDLMTKRHQFEKQRINLEREMAVAEIKRKYDELFHNLEMETLQKKKDVEILQAKVCKQQILAEAVRMASAGVVSCSQRGAPTRAMGEPNQSSGRQGSPFPASTTMYQSPQPAAESSTNGFLRQPRMTPQQGTANTSGRSAATLTHAPSGVMGTGITYHAPAPHLRAFINPLLVSRHGAASLER